MAARRNRRVVAGLVAAIVVGVIVFVLAYFQPQKLFIDDHVDEPFPVAGARPAPEPSAGTVAAIPDLSSTAPAAPVAERRGTFISREHSTSGTAGLYRLSDGRRVLRLEGLHTSNGPALFVYLSANPANGPEGAFDDSYHDLGELKGNIGSQNYEIPADVDPGQYQSVVIWCDRFDAAFGAADLVGDGTS